MRLFTNKSLLSKAKIVGKTLVVLILSALLFVPTPVLALDYTSTVQSYVSNVKIELDSVLKEIRNLPNLSYENGKTKLTEIEAKLEKIHIDARANSVKYGELSNESQKEYENLLTTINQLEEEDKNQVYNETIILHPLSNEFRRRNISIFGDNKYVYFFEFLRNHCEADEGLIAKYGAQYYVTFELRPCVTKLLGDDDPFLQDFRDVMSIYYIIDRIYKLVVYKGCKTDVSSKEFMGCAIPTLVQANQLIGTNYYSLDGMLTKKEGTHRFLQAYHIQTSLRNLRIKSPVLQKAIVLTNKISNLSDKVEKRINLVKQKYGNVKDYADALASFSDPDILGEIRELDQLIADLTKNLAWKA